MVMGLGIGIGILGSRGSSPSRDWRWMPLNSVLKRVACQNDCSSANSASVFELWWSAQIFQMQIFAQNYTHACIVRGQHTHTHTQRDRWFMEHTHPAPHTHTHTLYYPVVLKGLEYTQRHTDTGVTWRAGQELQQQIHMQDAGLSVRNFGLLMAKRGSAKHFWKCVTGTDWLSPAENWELRTKDRGPRTKDEVRRTQDSIQESFGRSQHLLVAVELLLLQTSAAGNTLTNATSTYNAATGCPFESFLAMVPYHLPTAPPSQPTLCLLCSARRRQRRKELKQNITVGRSWCNQRNGAAGRGGSGHRKSLQFI